MGKQTTGILKKKAQKLFSMYPKEFEDDFEKNKKTLDSTGLFEYSKRDRNLVAGYMARMVKKLKKQED